MSQCDQLFRNIRVHRDLEENKFIFTVRELFPGMCPWELSYLNKVVENRTDILMIVTAHTTLSKFFQPGSNVGKDNVIQPGGPWLADTTPVGKQVLEEPSQAETLFQYGFSERNKSFKCAKNPKGISGQTHTGFRMSWS